ncbi:MAG: malate synthase A, partial [Pseudomonadota bacterium]|nr:malate synthase A [Pseudomonadota bacterium]
APPFDEILTPDALDFVAGLEVHFSERRRQLLRDRQQIQARLDADPTLDFLPETASIRSGDWEIAGTPDNLRDRRVEITGPVDRKMVINALNSGARVFMADFEDAHSPTWEGTLQGQINVRDAINDDLAFTNPQGKRYEVGDDPAVLIARVRGWHLEEKHFLVNDRRASGALFDFGLFLFHNHRQALARGKGVYFYLPKMEHHEEAKLWSDVFAFAEDALGMTHGTIKCTALIETITAVFQMDEILYQLRDYIVGLNAGRWDYIFSFIKRFRNHPEFLLPDRSMVTMDQHFLHAYSRLLIKTCHRRGAHAMGGMAAQIPIKDDLRADAAAREKVRDDKLREARDGHDGTWVAHPGLVPTAMEVFQQYMPEANQIHRKLPVDEMAFSADDLLRVPEGKITMEGVRTNVSAAVHYVAAWLQGRGAVPLHNLMEDAATAEISRAQLWQWIRHPEAKLEDGREITAELFQDVLTGEMETIRAETTARGIGMVSYEHAAGLLREIVLDDEFAEFLTLPAYELLD